MRATPFVRRWFALVALGVLVGCGGSVDVTRVYSPADAARADRTKLEPLAVVRDGTRIPIPPGAKIEADRVVLGAGEHVHKLGPNDVIVTDSEGRIVAVRTPGNPPTVTQFVPGTATSPEGSDFVRGQLAGAQPGIDLRPTDRIEMHGQFETDDKVPGGGVVETNRSTGAIVGGVLLLATSYVPSAYVGATSTYKGDRVLLAPVVGPWFDYASRPKCQPPQGVQLPVDPCTPESLAKIGLITAGIAQGLGALVLSLALPSTTTVVYDRDRATARARTKPSVHVVPTGNGAAIIGQF